jgi:outer membrane protein assembly factor BamB
MRARRVLLLLGVLGVVGTLGYIGYRKGWFASDSENAAEIERLRGKKLEQPPAADATAGWFQWRGPTRDGRAPTGPLRTDWDKNPPKLLWRADVGGGFSSCTVVGGRLYTQDRQGGDERVLCLDTEKGTPVWSFSYPASYSGTDATYATGPRASPTVVGDRVYTVGGAGKLLCLEVPTGAGQPRVVWQHDLLAEFDATIPRWGVACSPLVEGDLVVVITGGKRGTVAAFERNTGELRWASGDNPAGYSSPVAATVGNRRVIFALTGDALLAVGLDGTIHDRHAWRTDNLGNIATPLVVDDVVFISSAYGQGCALLRADPERSGVGLVKVYERRGPRAFQTHHSSSVYKDRHLFGSDGMGSARLKCVTLEDGREKWDAGQEVGKGTLILADKHLIIQTERGDLCLVEANPDEFNLVAKLPRVLTGNNNWATPTLVDGRLYLRDDEKVVCYDVRP